jgi:hypothetical protein
MPTEPVLHRKDRELFLNLQKNYWKNFQNLSGASSLFRNDKEFHLALYNKLWENILNKDNRLWTFLAVYGAVIGVAFGISDANSFRVEGGIFVAVLTYWAAEIVMSSDWWSIRNRLMVRGIERRVGDATKGVIPYYYQSPEYSSESINNVNLFVFGLIACIFFALSVGLFSDNLSKFSEPEFISITILYLLSIIFIFLIGHRREKHISYFFRMFKVLNEEEKGIVIEGVASVEDDEIDRSEKRNRNSRTFRLYILILYLIFTIILGIRYIFMLKGNIFLLYVVIQLFFIVIYVYQWITYSVGEKIYGFSIIQKKYDSKQQDSKKRAAREYINMNRVLFVTLFLGSIVMIIITLVDDWSLFLNTPTI